LLFNYIIPQKSEELNRYTTSKRRILADYGV